MMSLRSLFIIIMILYLLEIEDAAGVLITCIFLFFAYSTSILSIPTPPLPIIFNPGHSSIKSFLALVALLTSNTSMLLVFIYSMISS